MLDEGRHSGSKTMHTPQARYKPKARPTASLAPFVGIAAALLLLVLFFVNREHDRHASEATQAAAKTGPNETWFESDGKPPSTPAPQKAAPAPPQIPATVTNAPSAALVAPSPKELPPPPKTPPPAPPEKDATAALPSSAADAGKSPKSETVEETAPPAKASSAKRKTAAPPAAETPLSLTANEIEAFLASAREANVKTVTAGGLALKARLIPDTLDFRAAEKARALFEKGVAAEKVLEEVASHFANRRAAEADKPFLELTVWAADGMALFMTPTPLARSFKVKLDDVPIACDVTATTKIPDAKSWKVWFGKVSGSREPTPTSLHQITEPLRLQLAVRGVWPEGKSLSIAVANFRHVADKPRGPRDLEGVNLGLKQIHKPDRESFNAQAELRYTKRGVRDVEPPAAFKALRAAAR
jgi:hypothetical protein